MSGAPLPAERASTLAPPPALLDRRAAVAALPLPAPHPDLDVTELDLDGVRCLAVGAPGARDTVVHLHGGGYRLGAPETFAPFIERLALATGARVVAVDYRLAPEHPYPSALHDALRAYRALLPASGPAPVVVGDSAGGGLAAALVHACRRQEVPLPRGLVLLSAWADLRCTAETYRSRAGTDRLFAYDAAREAAAQYLQGSPAEDPYASPLLGDLTGFPPTLLLASTDEALLDDTLALAAGLARAGVPVRAEVRPGLPHAWPTVAPDHPETGATVRTLAAFVASLTDPTSTITEGAS